MKKSLAMLLAVILLLLPACGPEASAGNTSSASPVEQTEAPAEADALVPSDNYSNSSGPAVEFNPSATIEETVLVDESDVKITATGIKYTAYAIKLNLTIENNSSQNLSFYAGTLGYSCNSVNGYMVDDGYLNASVGPGKKSNETVSFDVNELTLLGLTDIADIDLGFNITDDNYKDYLKTGPRQLKTSLTDSYNYTVDTYRQAITNSSLAKQIGFTIAHYSEDVPFDQKGIRVVSQTLVNNSSGEQALLVEIENTSDDMAYVSVGDVALNGLDIQSGAWSTDWIGGGKRRVVSMNLSSMLDESYREAFGLSKIGAVSYSFEVKDIDRDTLVIPQTLTFSIPGSAVSYDASGEELYQEDGIRIVSKGLALDSFDLSDDIHVLLLVENGSSEKLSFDVDYNSVSVNGYMTSFLCYSRQVSAGGSAVLDTELTGYSLEDNGISSLEDITEVELTIEVKNGSYKTVANPIIRFETK